jgi:hypothetical protein
VAWQLVRRALTSSSALVIGAAFVLARPEGSTELHTEPRSAPTSSDSAAPDDVLPRARFTPTEVAPGGQVEFVVTGYSQRFPTVGRPDDLALLIRELDACEFRVPFHPEEVVVDAQTGTMRGVGTRRHSRRLRRHNRTHAHRR